MAENQLSEREAQQIEELHRRLTEQPQLEALGPADICGIWQQVKPYWPIIVKAVRLIPKVGNLVAEILEQIGQWLDRFCAGGGENG
jgi:hypothetical protein